MDRAPGGSWPARARRVTFHKAPADRDRAASPGTRRSEMAATRTSETRLSDEDVAKVMGLIKGSDSVELKLTVPESEHSGTVSALEMDPLDAQIRQVFFFDTPDLTLYEHGVVARARRVQRK